MEVYEGLDVLVEVYEGLEVLVDVYEGLEVLDVGGVKLVEVYEGRELEDGGGVTLEVLEVSVKELVDEEGRLVVLVAPSLLKAEPSTDFAAGREERSQL